MTNSIQAQIVEIIGRSNDIAILPSTPLDGDSVGSALAMSFVLQKLGKKVTIVGQDNIPELLQFLPNVDKIEDSIASSKDFVISIDCSHTKVATIKTNEDGDNLNIIITPKNGLFSEGNFQFKKARPLHDLIITVDCAETKQLGKIYKENVEMFSEIPVINIDHHISNDYFGRVNYVDIMSASTAEMVFGIIKILEEKYKKTLMDADVATLILTGIITDTGSFQNANTTPVSFENAAELISFGARQQEIIQHVYKTKRLSQLRLWGRVLSKLQVDEKFRIVWSTITKKDLAETESTIEQTGDIIDELMTNAPGAEVVMLIKEKDDGKTSVSVRTTNPSVNASTIAEHFGGGGHVQASGFTILGREITEVEKEIIGYVRSFQAKRLRISDSKVTSTIEEVEKTPIIDIEGLIKQAKEAERANKLMKSEKSMKEASTSRKLSENNTRSNVATSSKVEVKEVNKNENSEDKIKVKPKVKSQKKEFKNKKTHKKTTQKREQQADSFKPAEMAEKVDYPNPPGYSFED